MPTASDDAFEVDQDSQKTIGAGIIFANDADPDTGDKAKLTAQLVVGPNKGPEHGSLLPNGGLSSDGSFTYKPNPGSVKEDSFFYKAVDPAGAASGEAKVVITVKPKPNKAPSVDNHTFAAEEEKKLENTVATGATDPDGDTLTFSLVSVFPPPPGFPPHMVSVKSDGAFEFTGSKDFAGEAFVQYKASDGRAESIGTVTINVSNVNDKPAAGKLKITGLGESERRVFDLRSFVNDPDQGYTLRLVASGFGNHGVLEDLGNSKYAFTSHYDLFGLSADFSFSYTVSDGKESDSGFVDLEIVRCDVAFHKDEKMVLKKGGKFQTRFVPKPKLCSWRFLTDAPWLTATLASQRGVTSGKGPAQLLLEAAPNTTGLERVAFVRVVRANVAGGQIGSFLVTQTGRCYFKVSVAIQGFPANGGTSDLQMNTPSGCTWSARPDDRGSFLLVSAQSKTGPGKVDYLVEPNLEKSRRGGSIRFFSSLSSTEQCRARHFVLQEADGSTAPTAPRRMRLRVLKTAKKTNIEVTWKNTASNATRILLDWWDRTAVPFTVQQLLLDRNREKYTPPRVSR